MQTVGVMVYVADNASNQLTAKVVLDDEGRSCVLTQGGISGPPVFIDGGLGVPTLAYSSHENSNSGNFAADGLVGVVLHQGRLAL
jgi:hypothetical protein